MKGKPRVSALYIIYSISSYRHKGYELASEGPIEDRLWAP